MWLLFAPLAASPPRELTLQPARPLEEHAVLFVVDHEPSFQRRCLSSVRDLREAGQYTGPVVIVSDGHSPELRRESEALNARLLNVSTVLPADLYPVATPTPCGLLPRKRRDGASGYHLKALISMSPFWSERYRTLLFLDCGMKISAPVEPFFAIDRAGKLVAHSNRDPNGLARNLLDTELKQECSPTAYTQLLNRYGTQELAVDYFMSTLMLYDTELLRDGQALREVARLYREAGPFIDGDQSVLSLYWVVNRSAWLALPSLLPGRGQQCYFDYVPFPALGCSSYVAYKHEYKCVDCVPDCNGCGSDFDPHMRL
ncbi:hypothetical protein AB1Y20_023253 [Prymnesium parvum]|uniref:Hexosyltransferase n=1 Tax=Prymnesium parvum TaxID=97485 RepID=A0AB34JFU7_PRYPA